MQSLTLRWQPIRTLSETMMVLANEGEWEQVAALEIERRGLLELFFNAPVIASDSAELTGYIEFLLAQDKVMMSMGTAASGQIQGKITSFATGRKAKKAYAKHS